MEKKISLIGLFVNLILGISKIIVGLISKSSAIIADGIHSGMDVLSSLISYIGIKISKKPADKEHPYGHYKAEVISGFVITIILFLTGLVIIYKSIIGIFSPEEVIINFLSIGVIIFSIIINWITSYIKIKYGKKYDNISLVSDGTHDKMDSLTSVGVLIGLMLTPYIHYADSIIAILLGIYILKESFSLGKQTTDSLLDVSAGEEVETKIKDLVEKEKIKIKDLKTQKRGPKIFVDIKIILSSKLKIEEASIITKKLENKLMEHIKNLDYIAIEIVSHDIKESYFKGMFGKGFGWQKRGKFKEKFPEAKGSGPGGFCVCPKGHYQEKHERGKPCSTLKCPKCGKKLERS